MVNRTNSGDPSHQSMIVLNQIVKSFIITSSAAIIDKEIVIFAIKFGAKLFTHSFVLHEKVSKR